LKNDFLDDYENLIGDASPYHPSSDAFHASRSSTLVRDPHFEEDIAGHHPRHHFMETETAFPEMTDSVTSEPGEPPAEDRAGTKNRGGTALPCGSDNAAHDLVRSRVARLVLPLPRNREEEELFMELSPDPEKILVMIDNKGQFAGVSEEDGKTVILGRYHHKSIGNVRILTLEHDGWTWVGRIEQDMIAKNVSGFALVFLSRDRKVVRRA